MIDPPASRHCAAPPPAGPAPIPHLQKIADAYDWADPDFDRLLRTALRLPATFHRKQWEWVMILRALEARGALRPDARGIAFGAGREPLAFAVAERVGHLLVTDLYEGGSAWTTARTEDPRAFVMAAAPRPIDPARLDVARMDMLAIDHPGPPLDFAYSACSLEHVGTAPEDFVAHLAQVRTILKPGGVYVLTTEFVHGPTVPVPHCFFFGIDDLLTIVARAGFAAEPVFDARLRRCSLNAPSLDVTELGAGVEGLGRPHISPSRSGNVFTSCLLVLTNAPPAGPVEVLGHAGTLAWIAARQRDIEAALWRGWQAIALRPAMPSPMPGHAEQAAGTATAPRLLHSAWLGLPPGPFALRVMPPDGADLTSGRRAEVLLRRRRRGAPFDDATIAAAATGGEDVAFAFEAAPDQTYALVVHGPGAEAEPWAAFGRRRPAAKATDRDA